MSAPRFLTVSQVERLHRAVIARFGGTDGLRDRQLFEGAVVHPRNVFYYGRGDVFDVAAAYAFHIAQAQAFLDGNKRTGIAAALAFLEGNGIRISSDTDALYDAMIGAAERRTDKAAMAEVLRRLAGT